MKLSPALLRRIVLEEAKKLEEKFGKMKDVEDAPKDTKELGGPDDYADTLGQKIDFMKALKIKEDRLRAALKQIQEKRSRVKAALIEKL